VNDFCYYRPKNPEQASRLMKQGAVAKAGGIDLLDRMKEGVATPAALVDLLRLRDAGTPPITVSPTMARISAFATLAEVAAHPGLRREYAALAAAAGEAATLQIRNLATAGGNLLQAPRCWYYRQTDFSCHQKGGTGCPAVEGENDLHAILGYGDCPAVHPSNLAVPLTALKATLVFADGEPSLPIAKVCGRGPFPELAAGRVLTRIDVPAGGASAYVEIRHRQTFEWALASAAVARDLTGAWSVVLGAVAPIPWRAPAAEAILGGKTPDAALIARAADAAVEGARPLSRNGYKVKLARTAVVRALLAAVGGGK
jgi:xanthine dehydrogenase YagS FAD-binding subunit